MDKITEQQKPKVSREMAVNEINSWLSAKKIKESQREANKDSIETLVECVVDGDIIVNDDNSLTQNLLFPIGKNEDIKQLKYNFRLNDRMLEPHLKGVKSTEVFSVLAAYRAALTNETKGVLSQMDSADLRVSNSIVVFFM